MQLELRAAVVARAHHDFADMRPQAVAEFFRVPLAAGEVCLHVLDPERVFAPDRGMEGDQFDRVLVGHLGIDRSTIGIGGRQIGLHFVIGSDAVSDRAHQTLDAALNLRAPAIAARARGAPAAVFFVGELAPLVQKFFSPFGRQHLVLQGGDNAIFQGLGADRRRVAAGPLVPAVRAAPIILGLYGDGAAAYTAFDQPGKQALGAPLLGGGDIGDGIEARRYSGPCCFIDNAQIFDLRFRPLFARIRFRNPAPGGRVSFETLAIVEDRPVIERVVQDAVGALSVAHDRAGIPFAAARAADPVAVEIARDRQRRAPRKIFGEDPPHHVGLVFVDLRPATFRFATRIELVDRAIAIAAPAGDPAGARVSDLPAADLVAQILEKQGGHRALEPDMNFGDVAVGERHQTRPGEAQRLEDAGDILLIARQSVDRFADDDVELVGRGDQRVELGPIARRAADSEVRKYRIDPPPFSFCALRTDMDLIVDRSFILPVARKSSVDGAADHAVFPVIAIRCRASWRQKACAQAPAPGAGPDHWQAQAGVASYGALP